MVYDSSMLRWQPTHNRNGRSLQSIILPQDIKDRLIVDVRGECSLLPIHSNFSHSMFWLPRIPSEWLVVLGPRYCLEARLVPAVRSDHTAVVALTATLR